MLFQSIGAQYTIGSSLRHLFRAGRSRHGEQLRNALKARYGGEVILYHKGRAALAEAVRLVTNQGDSVAVVALTCYSVPQAVWAAGCEVVYIDINESDLQFSAQEFEQAISAHPTIKAVIIQNTLGVPADIVGIEKVAKSYKVAIIEDLAHSAGAQYSDGREVGTVGDVTMLSFGKDKALDVVNGGALVVRNKLIGVPKQPTRGPSFSEQLRDRVYPLLAVTSRALYRIAIGKVLLAGAYKIGLARRSADGDVYVDEQLPNWQASLLVEQLTGLDARVMLRQKNAAQIATLSSGNVVERATQVGASLLRVPFLVDEPSIYVDALKVRGILVNDIWYDVPVAPRRYYGRAKFDETAFPNAVRIASRLVNLPTHEKVSAQHISIMKEVFQEVTRSE